MSKPNRPSPPTLSPVVLGLALCALAAACTADQGRERSLHDRDQDDVLGAGAVVVSPEMMDLIVEWSEQDPEQTASFLRLPRRGPGGLSPQR